MKKVRRERGGGGVGVCCKLISLAVAAIDADGLWHIHIPQ